jgi:integrase
MEYPRGSNIKVRERANGSYIVDIPKKVSGTARIRKTLPTQANAKEFARNRYDQFKRLGSGLLGLSDTERAEAVQAFEKCKRAGVSLMQALDEGIPILQSKAQDMSFSDVVQSRIAFKKQRLEINDIREATYIDFKTRATMLENALGHYHIAEINRKVIMDYFNADKSGQINRKNQLQTLSQITKYAVEEGYIPTNVCDTLTESDKISIRGSGRTWKEPVIMDFKHIEPFIIKALECSHLNVFNSIIVQLFCGVRPEEVTKLVWEDFDFSERTISISSRFAKGRFIREVEIPDNAMKWLSLSDRSKPFANSIDRQNENRMRAFRTAFGEVTKKNDNGKQTEKKTWWKNSILRHTFASYHYARWRDECGSTKTENAMGHRTGDTMLFTHYRKAVKRAKSIEYFNIVPNSTEKKVIKISSVA